MGPFTLHRISLPARLLAATCGLLLVQTAGAQQLPVQITSTALPLAGIGQAYRFQLTAIGGKEPYRWTAAPTVPGATNNPLPQGMALSSDGLLSGQPITGGTFAFRVTANAADQGSSSADLSLIVVRVLTDSPLPPGQSNVPYNVQLSVSAGAPAWALASGQLPNGLSLSSTGVISGTPASTGTFTFGAQATIPNVLPAPAVLAQKSFELVITPGPLGLVTSSLPDGIIGQPYSQVVRAAGGEPPYTITATASTLPPGITFIGSQLLTGTPTATGTFNVQFQLRDNANATATRTIPLRIVTESTAGPAVQAAPSSLRFNSFENGGPTPPQFLAVTSIAGAAAAFTVEQTSFPPWLTLINPSTTTPAQIRLRAQPGTFPPGTYESRVRLLSTNQLPVDVPVSLVVRAAQPQIEVAPRIVQVTSRTVAPRADIYLALRSTGGGPAIDFNLRITNGSRWITRVAANPTRLSAGQPVAIQLSLDATGLRPGAYRDEIRIESTAGNLRVPVSLFIEGSDAGLDVPVRGVRLRGRVGDLPDGQQTVPIRNLGGTGSVLNWTATVVRGPDVFAISPVQGTVAAGAPSSLTVSLKPGALETAGSKTALLRINDSRLLSAPSFVVLVADVAPAAAPARFELPTAGLYFIGIAGGAAPAPQTFQLRTSARLLNYTAATSTSDGANWLRIAATSGSTAAGSPASINVSANTTGLGAGIYTGLVTIAANSEIRSAAITLVLLPTGAKLAAADPKSTVAPRLAEGCTPTRSVIVQTALTESFAVPAGWPATLTARLLDNCGTILTAGDMVASFSNGDAPIVLDTDPQTGVFTGTWQPGAVAASATVKLDAASGTLEPATLEITGGVEANAVNPPSLVTAGLLNNLNPIVGAPLAPGTVTQAYGDNLTTNPDAPSTVPLPTVYKGVEAIIGGLSAPIYYISKNQLTIQVPSELAPNRLHSAILATDAGYSLPTQLPLVPVQPGTVSFNNGSLVAQHGDFSLITAASPARPNEVITIYLVGMGVTTPAVPSGAPAPSVPLASVNTTATVTVDGQPASIIFQGLTPGGVGLYQINFRVPATARAGNLDIVIAQDGIEANSTKLPVGTP